MMGSRSSVVARKLADSESSSPARNGRIRVAFLKREEGQEVARQLGKCHTHSYRDSPSQRGPLSCSITRLLTYALNPSMGCERIHDTLRSNVSARFAPSPRARSRILHAELDVSRQVFNDVREKERGSHANEELSS